MVKSKNLFITFISVILLFSLCSCGNNQAATEDNSTENMNSDHTHILFTMSDGKTFEVETYPEFAPETCRHFVELVKSGFYNGLTFHRVIDDFMAQGGDPEGTGTGRSPNGIYGEFRSNGFEQNTLSHQRGVISMARTQNPDSAYSQFFICYTDCSYLDGNYAAFGKVTKGMETIDSFLEVEREMGSDGKISHPKTPIVIESAVILDA